MVAVRLTEVRAISTVLIRTAQSIRCHTNFVWGIASPGQQAEQNATTIYNDHAGSL